MKDKIKTLMLKIKRKGKITNETNSATERLYCGNRESVNQSVDFEAGDW